MATSNIILYPTDTIYGLGVDATDPEAVLRLKELKGRDDLPAQAGGKPISIAVSDVEMLRKYAEVTPLAEKLATRFLPGKLTIVLNAKNLPDELTAGGGTVGIRIPNHPKALELIRKLGKPITATSANVSGMPPERSVEKILAQFGNKGAMIYHSADIPPELPESGPSTVVDARGGTPLIIREGAIETKDLLQ